MFERFFALSAHGTSVRREIVAGATTFLTMAYIMFVNPQILAHAGMDPGAVFVATCVASALTTALMGLYANLPVALAARGVIGAVLVAIVAATVAAMLLHLAPVPAAWIAMPSRLHPTFMQMTFTGVSGGAIAVAVFAFLMVEMLDTSGTLTAVAQQAKLIDNDGRLKHARRALTTDAVGTMIGAVLGTSPVTAYIESAAGVQAGGRTGLTAVVVALLFLLSLFFAPLAGAVPAFATAPALVFVAALMARGLADIDWEDMTEAAPALVTALAIPFTYSIAGGIGIGFIAYALIKLVSGRRRDVNAAVAIIAVAFAIKLAIG